MKKIRMTTPRTSKHRLTSYWLHKITGRRHWFAVSSTFYARGGDHTPHSISVDSLSTVGLVDRAQSTNDWRGIRKLIGPGLVKELLARRLVKDGYITIKNISYLGWF